MHLPEGPTKYIHVNPAAIRSNSKLPQDKWRPVCAVSCEDQTYHCYRVEIHGPSTLEYEPGRKGATVRIHTTSPITLHNRWPSEGS